MLPWTAGNVLDQTVAERMGNLAAWNAALDYYGSHTGTESDIHKNQVAATVTT